MHGTHGIGADGLAGGRLGDAKIRDFYFSFLGDDDILRFDIPVHNVLRVRGFDSLAYLYGDTDGFLHLKTFLFLDILLQGDAFHQLHDNVMEIFRFPYVKYVDNVGMRQTGGRLCFGTKFLYEILIGIKFRL